MLNIKWIKIAIDIFDDNKIKLIDTMPDRDAILVVWFKLLIEAGKHNADGWININDERGYSDEELATIVARPVNTVRLAMKIFAEYGMIELYDKNKIRLKNWHKHQNVEGLSRIREQNRLRAQKHRDRQKGNAPALPEPQIKKPKLENINKKDVLEYWNIRTSDNIPKLKFITKGRLQKYKLRVGEGMDLDTVITKINKSPFLQGDNKSGWKATFDWVVRNGENWSKICEGNYDKKEKKANTNSGWGVGEDTQSNS